MHNRYCDQLRSETKPECSLDFGVLQIFISSIAEYPTVSFDLSTLCTFWCNQALFFHKATCDPQAASGLQADINSMKAFTYCGLIFSPLPCNSQFLFPQILMNTIKQVLLDSDHFTLELNFPFFKSTKWRIPP